MEVQITKCSSNPSAWYSTKIGERFKVKPSKFENRYVVDDGRDVFLIRIDDCMKVKGTEVIIDLVRAEQILNGDELNILSILLRKLER